jgi:hypothetical protein
MIFKNEKYLTYKNFSPMHFNSQFGFQLFRFIRQQCCPQLYSTSHPPPLWRNSSISPQSAELKIYVAAVEALKKKERQDEFQFTTKIGGKTSLVPSYFIL